MDVTQDDLIQVFRKIGQFEGRSSLGAWIRRIVVNTSLLALKRKRRRLQFIIPWRFFEKNDEDGERPFDLPGDDDAEGNDPLEALSTKELQRDVRKAMEGLSEKQRTVFVLKVFEEMTITEIADLTGMALGTVKTHLFRATRTVRDRLTAMGYGTDSGGDDTMKDCKDFEKALILDVLGELDPKELPQWAAHAAACAACRVERERLARMMDQVKAAATPAPLSPQEAAGLHARIRWALNNAGRAAKVGRSTPFWKGFGPKPAWAFGMLLCFILAFSGVHWKGAVKNTLETGPSTLVLMPADQEPTAGVKREPVPVPAAGPSSPEEKTAAPLSQTIVPEEDLPEQDLEVLENLDFLKELDTIRKVVHVVDQDDDAPAPSDASDSARQPMSLDPRDASYA